MLIPYEVLRQACEGEGLEEREPFTFYYGNNPDDTMIFTPEPDPDGYLDLDFTTEQFALWDEDLAQRIKDRILELLQPPHPSSH